MMATLIPAMNVIRWNYQPRSERPINPVTKRPYGLMSKLLPSGVTIVGFIAVFLALAVLAFFVYRMSGEVSWLHGYLTPGGGSTTP